MEENKLDNEKYKRISRLKLGSSAKCVLNSLDAGTSIVLSVFKCYSKMLQDSQDKYERLYKLRRDITMESKRIIFLLLSIDRDDKKEKVLKEAEIRMENLIANQFNSIAQEIKGEDPWLYHRAYSGGNQEFIEAFTLYEYIKNEDISGPQTCRLRLTYSDGSTAFLTNSDYLLGLFDLTGELMRHGIAGLNRGNLELVQSICKFLRKMYAALLSLHLSGQEMRIKMSVLKKSLLKMENICYHIHVRGSELPQHLFPSSDDITCNNDEGFSDIL